MFFMGSGGILRVQGLGLWYEDAISVSGFGVEGAGLRIRRVCLPRKPCFDT